MIHQILNYDQSPKVVAVVLRFQNWIGKDKQIAPFSMMVTTILRFNNLLRLKVLDTNMVYLWIWNNHLQRKRNQKKLKVEISVPL